MKEVPFSGKESPKLSFFTIRITSRCFKFTQLGPKDCGITFPLTTTLLHRRRSKRRRRCCEDTCSLKQRLRISLLYRQSSLPGRHGQRNGTRLQDWEIVKRGERK
jgi:hypothetical protein